MNNNRNGYKMDRVELGNTRGRERPTQQKFISNDKRETKPYNSIEPQ